MKNNVIYINGTGAVTGVPTPRYKAQKIRQDRDPDLFINMLAHHPGHIARAKEKRERILAEERAREEAARRARAENQRTISTVGQVSMATMLAMTVATALQLS